MAAQQAWLRLTTDQIAAIDTYMQAATGTALSLRWEPLQSQGNIGGTYDPILAIDQGTTSSRAIVFDKDMKIVASAQEEFTQHFPQSGWVEHEVADLWSTTVATSNGALAKAGDYRR